MHACIHPYGEGAVFWGEKKGYPRVWHHSFGSTAPTPLTPVDYSAIQPSYDGEGERIVFLSDRDSDHPKMTLAQRTEGWQTRTYTQQGYLNVYTMLSDGSDVRRITRGQHLDFRPALSPDGSMIAFLSDRSGQPYRLHTIPADGSAEPRLLLESPWVGRPWYSIDGTWIYFFADVGEHRRICRIPSEGGDWEPVTPEGYPRSHGTFCDLDGKHLWFHSTRGNTTHIYRYCLEIWKIGTDRNLRISRRSACDSRSQWQYDI